MDDLKGRVALVTGGSRGIGRAIALALADAGADIAVNYHSRTAEAEAVAAEIRRRGRRAITVAANVASATEVKRLAAEAAAFGPVGILVNNAGIAHPVTLDTLDQAAWDETLLINLTSAFLATQAVLPGMRAARWGRIINISSTAAQIGGIIGPHYAASKAGMIGMMHGYAALLAGEGVTANAVAPALIETDMIRGNDRAQPERIPVGRFGRAEEVAEAVVMLARNGYITGQTINVNGGAYMG